jgi:hypothetical protein
LNQVRVGGWRRDSGDGKRDRGSCGHYADNFAQFHSVFFPYKLISVTIHLAWQQLCRVGMFRNYNYISPRPAPILLDV